MTFFLLCYEFRVVRRGHTGDGNFGGLFCAPFGEFGLSEVTPGFVAGIGESGPRPSRNAQTIGAEALVLLRAIVALAELAA